MAENGLLLVRKWSSSEEHFKTASRAIRDEGATVLRRLSDGIEKIIGMRSWSETRRGVVVFWS